MGVCSSEVEKRVHAALLTRAATAPALPSGSEPALLAAARCAVAARPALIDSLGRFVLTALQGCAPAVPLEHHLRKLHAVDLLIVSAVLDREPSACAQFENDLASELERLSRSMGTARAADVEDVLRQRLLFGDGASSPALAAYRGVGPFKSWLRVSVVREALRFKKADSPGVELDEAEALGVGTDPELRYMKVLYRDEFKVAFRQALARLTARQRAVLRFVYVDLVPVDKVASAYAVHRVTASKWLSEARATLGDHIRQALKDRLQLGSEDVDSLVRLGLSKPEISLGGLLQDDDPVKT